MPGMVMARETDLPSIMIYGGPTGRSIIVARRSFSRQCMMPSARHQGRALGSEDLKGLRTIIFFLGLRYANLRAIPPDLH